MRPVPLIRIAALLGTATMLAGCVAAAIPVIAGGAIVRTGTDGKDARASVEKVLETPLDAAADRPQDRPRIANAEAEVFAGPAPAPMQPRSPGGAEPFAEFVSYALGSMAPGRGARPPSAMLADPASLDDARRPCPPGPPTVLIDLDPASGMVPVEFADEAGTRVPGLADALARLRERGMAVAWISSRSAGDADVLRRALTASGLDPKGQDRLVLMRYPGDRKQTRREELAASACILAIAGDERSDFDELFDYLLNREAALGLEPLIGDGWFLVPPPFPSDQRPKP